MIIDRMPPDSGVFSAGIYKADSCIASFLDVFKQSAYYE